MDRQEEKQRATERIKNIESTIEILNEINF